MTGIALPRAPIAFDRMEEQVFRDLVRKGVQDSVSRSSIFNPNTNQPLFFGQPHAQAFGTDSAFVVAPSTLTYLPMPDMEMTHPNLVASGEFKAAYQMDIEIAAQIYHPPPGGAARTAQYDLYASVWNGTTYISDTLVGSISQDFAVGWSLHFSGMALALGVSFIRLRMFHNDSANNTFDLTKSWMNVKQLSLEPAMRELRT